ncbi:MAG: hypothetical protein Q9219_007686 [cf. Caloplaca sp. 3 TL-2023]
MKEDPPLEARCRDKFLVQTVALSRDSDASNIPAIWQNIEKTSKSSIQERKIRVVFLATDGNTTAPPHQMTNGQHFGDEAPPAYGSPAPSFESPGPNAITSVHRPTSDNKSHTVSTAESTSSNLQSSASAAASNVTNSIPVPSVDLQAQLVDAKSEISRLTQQAREQSLKQQKAEAASQKSQEQIGIGGTGISTQQQSTDGVPVQIVAALCLLSFLLAYFFF